MNKHLATWYWEAPLGLIIIGFGLSLLGKAISIYAAPARPLWRWFVWGTLSLVVINSGISLFGDAVKHRTLYEMLHKTEAQQSTHDR